jgi:hypothetical protein
MVSHGYAVSFMLRVTYKALYAECHYTKNFAMLSVIIPKVVMLSVVIPKLLLC